MTRQWLPMVACLALLSFSLVLILVAVFRKP